jgi:NADPH:quinone reductase-like Zn-dependent oxidoreductase
MKAFIVDRYGKKDGVRIGEMPDPDLRENDVLVQVHAAAVNLLDSDSSCLASEASPSIEHH